MRRVLTILLTLVFVMICHGEYQQGDIVENISFTAHNPDGSTTETSIYEQIDAGKAVLLFWGESW